MEIFSLDSKWFRLFTAKNEEIRQYLISYHRMIIFKYIKVSKYYDWLII